MNGGFYQVFKALLILVISSLYPICYAFADAPNLSGNWTVLVHCSGKDRVFDFSVAQSGVSLSGELQEGKIETKKRQYIQTSILLSARMTGEIDAENLKIDLSSSNSNRSPIRFEGVYDAKSKQFAGDFSGRDLLKCSHAVIAKSDSKKFTNSILSDVKDRKSSGGSGKCNRKLKKWLSGVSDRLEEVPERISPIERAALLNSLYEEPFFSESHGKPFREFSHKKATSIMGTLKRTKVCGMPPLKKIADLRVFSPLVDNVFAHAFEYRRNKIEVSNRAREIIRNWLNRQLQNTGAQAEAEDSFESYVSKLRTTSDDLEWASARLFPLKYDSRLSPTMKQIGSIAAQRVESQLEFLSQKPTLSEKDLKELVMIRDEYSSMFGLISDPIRSVLHSRSDSRFNHRWSQWVMSRMEQTNDRNALERLESSLPTFNWFSNRLSSQQRSEWHRLFGQRRDQLTAEATARTEAQFLARTADRAGPDENAPMSADDIVRLNRSRADRLAREASEKRMAEENRIRENGRTRKRYNEEQTDKLSVYLRNGADDLFMLGTGGIKEIITVKTRDDSLRIQCLNRANARPLSVGSPVEKQNAHCDLRLFPEERIVVGEEALKAGHCPVNWNSVRYEIASLKFNERDREAWVFNALDSKCRAHVRDEEDCSILRCGFRNKPGESVLQYIVRGRKEAEALFKETFKHFYSPY